MSANARGENRQQNSWGPVRDTATCVLLFACAVALIPVTVAATLGSAGFCLGKAVARSLERAWQWRNTQITLAGVPAEDRKRFRSELLILHGEMVREAARADRERADGGLT